jgi:GT2 family glycosyltransferase
MKLSIVIPVYNSWTYTKNVLNWFYKNQKDFFELIIVNNSSTDLTKTELIKFKDSISNLKIINNGNNYGFGKAVNIGINRSIGDFILILNNDIMIGSSNTDWLDSLIINERCFVGPTGGLLDKNFNFLYETEDPSKKINYMSGWCLCARRDVWDELMLPNCGPFDSDTFFCYFEDTDLSFRASEKKIPFKMVKIPVSHIGKQTSSKMNLSGMFLESKGKFLKKWKK